MARAILDRGAPGEATVALVIDQGIQAIAAILGVLTAGKPYVFRNPGVPPRETISS
jgi:acyl-CoA synthetase (AMP-forming)/AMP-acid ligase II